MSAVTRDEQPAAVTPPTVIIEPSHGWLSLHLGRVWRYRELLYFLVWRDVKVRYKQTALSVPNCELVAGKGLQNEGRNWNVY